MKKLLLFLCLLGLSTANAGYKLRITTFNIEWYGLGGDMGGKIGDEFRDATLRDWLRNYVPTTDVFVFQEIVDVPRFKKNVMGDKYKCYSYDHEYEKHQFVMICVRRGLSLFKEKGEKDYRFEEVALNQYGRPAVYGVLAAWDKDAENWRRLAHVMGVHLKAYPDKTDVRLKQAKIIAEKVKSYKDSLPVLVFGDYNTHRKEDSKQKQDDKVLIGRTYYKEGVSMSLLKSDLETYKNAEKKKNYQLDQIYVSSDVSFEADARVTGPCNKGGKLGKFKDLAYYNKNVSDHCPLSTIVELP